VEHSLANVNNENLATLRIRNSREHHLKWVLAWILAQSYANADSADKARILSVLGSMCTPASFHNGDLFLLNWALGLVGKDATPIMFKLADHKEHIVRCSAQDSLNSMSSRLSPSSPKLDCKVSQQQQKQLLERWWRWWKVDGEMKEYPTIPDPFDEPENAE
jgi:hypothetical protein